jgi:cytochrome c peroxidase
MHDGVFLSLEEVIEFLDKGGGANPNLSPLMKPLGLTQEEQSDLLPFLESLTGAPMKIAPPQLSD